MKKYILHIALGVSLILNIILLCILFMNGSSINNVEENDKFSDVNYRNNAAQNYMRQVICDNLYYPESYDPVSTTVDSVFYGPLTDMECVKAAGELIKYKSELPGAEDAYQEAVHQLQIFGSSGVFWRHADDKKKAEERLNNLKENIEKSENIIRHRDTSNDGKFVGWQIVHRYRAKTRGGDISFSDVLYVVDPEMKNWLFRYSLDNFDSDNLDALTKVIKETLGTNQE